MTEKKQSTQQTIQLILDILSFESSLAILKNQLETANIDWDAVVVIASKHLVLPAVYCRLEQKSLLDCLPQDLVLYLQELTKLNRERNQTLLNEAKDISKLFEKESINYTFIKGIALLAGNYFKDPGERMITDIDLLVASEDLDRAYDLLANEGYSNFLPFNYEVKNYRHRPRQISENHLGAIELHDQLLKYRYNHLIDKKKLLETKEIINGVAIPRQDYLIWNAVLAQQINEKAYTYNMVKLKGIYDVMALGLSQQENLLKTLSKQTYSLSFLSLASIFCPDLSPSKETITTSFKKNSFIFKMNYPKFGSLIYHLTSLYLGITERLKLVLSNKSYRRHVIKNKLIKQD